MVSKLDILGRRKRTYSDKLAGRQPVGKHIEISGDDLTIFQALDHCGVLSSKALFEFWPGKDWNTFQKRLTKLYNGVKPDPRKPGITYYLDWPSEQKQSHTLKSQHYVYSLAERGRQELERVDRQAKYIGIRSDPIKHRHYTGTALASFWIGALKNLTFFITRSDILNHPSCPKTTKESSTPLKVALKHHSKRKAIEPDELFGFDFGTSKRFHVWETDLGTESITRTGHGTTFEEKLEGYIEMIERGLFKEVYGIPRATIITGTTSNARIDSMIAALERLTEHRPKLRDHFLFIAIDHFGSDYFKPAPLIPELFTAPYRTANGIVHINKI